jgi:hypothetical protein
MSKIIEILSNQHQEQGYIYNRCFQSNQNVIYNFLCNRQGELLNIDDVKDYKKCLNNPEKYLDFGIESKEISWTAPTVALCSCGTKIELKNNINCCPKCGQWYDSFCKSLINPKYWDDEIA